MNKSLYSLMLSDSVIEQIDKLALRENTSRSSMVNRILAEHVSMVTPEMRISGIFRQIEALFSDESDLVPSFVPNSRVMSIKSSLQYKYRPTVRYELSLFKKPVDEIGELSVIFRTQSVQLLDEVQKFFVFFKSLEDKYIADSLPTPIRYELYTDKFIRSIPSPRNKDFSVDGFAKAVSSYVSLLDRLMKDFVSGIYGYGELERKYVSCLENGMSII